MKLYLILIGLALAGIAYIGLLRASNKKLKGKLKSETERADENAATIEQRDHIIKALEGAMQNEKEQKNKLHTGSNIDKFNASLDILSNKTGSKAGKS